MSSRKEEKTFGESFPRQHGLLGKCPFTFVVFLKNTLAHILRTMAELLQEARRS